MRARALVPRGHHPCRLWWATTLGLLVLLAMTCCRPAGPIIDTGPRPVEVDGTISGTVRGAEDTSLVEGRVVEVVNLDTNERQRVTTNKAGGFTFKVKPGKYRVELTLREGETLEKGPGVRHVNPGDIDARADFIISTRRGGVSGRISRPRSPASRVDPRLGAPTA